MTRREFILIVFHFYWKFHLHRKHLLMRRGSHLSTLLFLLDPTFISSSFIPTEDKIYFFFSEEGREYDFIEKFTVSRIAQVCTVSQPC